MSKSLAPSFWADLVTLFSNFCKIVTGSGVVVKSKIPGPLSRILSSKDFWLGEYFGKQWWVEDCESWILSWIQSMYFQILPKMAGLSLIPHPIDLLLKNRTITQCLKIEEKVSFHIGSKAGYLYILSWQKLFKNANNGQFWQVFENLKLAVKQCYQTSQF